MNEETLKDGVIAALSETNPKIATRNRKWIAKELKNERRHEVNMKVLDILRNDIEMKWLIVLFTGMGIDFVADQLQLTTTEEGAIDTGSDTNDYSSWIWTALGFFTGAGGLVSGASIFGSSFKDDSGTSKTFDNPWQLAAAQMENIGEGMSALALTMLTLHAIFGTGNQEGGGLFSSLAGML